jgi:hypothetical protein
MAWRPGAPSEDVSGRNKQASLRSFVESYQSEISFGDPESKKAVMTTLIASDLPEGDNLSLTPNYPGFTGLKWRP